MKRPPVRLLFSLLALAAIPLLILLVNQMLARGFDEADGLALEVEESQRVRDQLNTVLLAHQDMETGQRGYVVTGDPAFLLPFAQGRRRIDRELAGLGALAERSDELRSALPALRRLSAEKIALNERAIALVRDGRAAEAVRLVGTGSGREAMDRIRATISGIAEAERARLDQRSREAQSARRAARRTAFLLQTLLIVLLVLATWTGGRSIAEQRQIAARYRDSSVRQEAIFEAANDGMIIHDRDGTIESHNRAIAYMYGYVGDELVGRNIDILFETPPTRDEVHWFLDRLASDPTGRASDVREYRAVRKDGSLFDVDAATNLVPLGEGPRFLAVLRDATGRKEIERMKSEFVSTVSHELRTPLTSIAGSLGLIAGGVAGAVPEKAKRLIDIAHANSERLVRLVNDLLDMERLEAGKVALALAWVPLHPLLVRAIEELRGFAGRFDVDITLVSGDDTAIVVADEDRLQQVFVNLLSNAIKFSPPGSVVEVELVPHGQHHRICVSDRGPGIPEDFRGRIFGKFAQADSPDVRARGGTGLGLSIAREIVTQLGGAIGFDDRSGGGTRFHVDLPAVNEQLAGPLPEDADEGLPAIIHVDDDPDTLRLVASAFEGKAEVLSTPSVREGLAATDRRRFDAAILDIEMADGSGLDLIPHLVGGPAPVPVIIYSVHEPESSLRDRVDAILVKSRATLDQLVAETLARIGGRRRDDR